MEKSEYMFPQNKCSAASINEIKKSSISIIEFLRKSQINKVEKLFLDDEFYTILSTLERSLRDLFLKIIHRIYVSKEQTSSLSSFSEECENLLMLIFEQLLAHKIAYVFIPCICSISSMTYFIEPTFHSSQDVLIVIFAHYSQLRVFILDNMYNMMKLLKYQNVVIQQVENISKSFLFLVQSVPTVFRNTNQYNVFEEAQKQIQALTIHWISLFLRDIESNETNEQSSKIFCNFIRAVVKMLPLFKFPAAPVLLITVLRTLMSYLSSIKSSGALKKLALEQISFIVISLKKLVISSSTEDNNLVIFNLHEMLKSKLEKLEKCDNIDICTKVLLIRYMENQYNDTNSYFSPVPFFRLNFIRHINDFRQKVDEGVSKKRKLQECVINFDDSLKYYYDLLKNTKCDLDRREADTIYQYLVFSKSQLPLLVERYFERIILISATKDNSIRLSAVKRLIPLIEVNRNILFSRILMIAISSLILDQSALVRENILITVSKIILLNKPMCYAAIFENNFESILMRLLDVNVGVRKAVINLLKNFCLKNRNHKFVSKILLNVLGRIWDENESVKFQAVEMFKQLWFAKPDSDSDCSLSEIIQLLNETPKNIIYLFRYIFFTNSMIDLVPNFNIFKKILNHISSNENSFCDLKMENVKVILTKLSSHLTNTKKNKIMLPSM